jgi:murein L,D-transpeptidase YafK
MSRIRGNIFPLLRVAAALLLLSCMSPAPETPAPDPDAFASQLASLAGRLRLVISKSHYTLTLYKGDQPVKTYRAVFGKGYLGGDKQMQGDKRTPEGDFYICTMNHSKRFYKFMGLSYPGLKHAERGLQSRMISIADYVAIKKAVDGRNLPPWDTPLGGAVGIHGRTESGSSGSDTLAGMNWTDGCIALENADVDEIYSVASLGTPVTILP